MLILGLQAKQAGHLFQHLSPCYIQGGYSKFSRRTHKPLPIEVWSWAAHLVKGKKKIPEVQQLTTGRQTRKPTPSSSKKLRTSHFRDKTMLFCNTHPWRERWKRCINYCLSWGKDIVYYFSSHFVFLPRHLWYIFAWHVVPYSSHPHPTCVLSWSHASVSSCPALPFLFNSFLPVLLRTWVHLQRAGDLQLICSFYFQSQPLVPGSSIWELWAFFPLISGKRYMCCIFTRLQSDGEKLDGTE